MCQDNTMSLVEIIPVCDATVETNFLEGQIYAQREPSNT